MKVCFSAVTRLWASLSKKGLMKVGFGMGFEWVGWFFVEDFAGRKRVGEGDDFGNMFFCSIMENGACILQSLLTFAF